MFTKSQLNNMNYDPKYSSTGWITIIENQKDYYDLYKLYATNNSSISSGREYIALPADKVLSTNDYLKYNISK
jgi:hypothetical protein